MLTQYQVSEQQTRVVCQESNTLNVPIGTPSSGIIAGSQVQLFDEWVTFAAQFETFRIAAIHYDIYDINPSNPGPAWFGTFHDDYTTSTQPAFSMANVIDSTDSQLVPPGTGKISLVWRAHGPRENSFLPVAGGADFGGLRYFTLQQTSTFQKYIVITKAVIDFRGRK